MNGDRAAIGCVFIAFDDVVQRLIQTFRVAIEHKFRAFKLVDDQILFTVSHRLLEFIFQKI